MKNVLSVLMASFVAFMIFGVSGGSVLAAEKPIGDFEKVFGLDLSQMDDQGDCGCETVTLSGAERNKAVSDLLKGDSFKQIKQNAIKFGYTWDGANSIEVIKNITFGGLNLYAVPFTSKDSKLLLIFVEGQYTMGYFKLPL